MESNKLTTTNHEISTEIESNIAKLGRILKFTVEKGRFPKPKYVKDNSIFHVAEKTMKDFVKNRIKKIVRVNPIDIDELEILAELKTHNSIKLSDDRLLNRHISDTTGYLVENKSNNAIYIQICDESLSLEEESRVDLLLQPGDVVVMSSLQFALIALSCGSGKIGNAAVKMIVPQSVLDEIISKTSLMNLGNFIQLDRENSDGNILTLYVD